VIRQFNGRMYAPAEIAHILGHWDAGRESFGNRESESQRNRADGWEGPNFSSK
jgi:hypothetical protein